MSQVKTLHLDKEEVLDKVEKAIENVNNRLGYWIDYIEEKMYQIAGQKSYKYKLTIHRHGKEKHFAIEFENGDHIDLLIMDLHVDVLKCGSRLLGVSRRYLEYFLRANDDDEAIFDALFTFCDLATFKNEIENNIEKLEMQIFKALK